MEHLLPGRVGTAGVTAKNNRLFVEAVLYRYRVDILWRDLLKRSGDFRVIHTHHMRLCQTPQIFPAFLRKIVPAAPSKEHCGFETTILYAYDREVSLRFGAMNSSPKKQKIMEITQASS